MISPAVRLSVFPILLAVFLGASSRLQAQAISSLPDAPQPLSLEIFSSSLDLQAPSTPQPVPTVEKQQQPMTEEERRAAAEAQLQAELHQRMAGVVPNFNAVLTGTALPLSPGQKMRAAFRSAIDPYQFGLAVVTSGYGQATASHSSIEPNFVHHGYPAGWKGFGMRYGANYLDQFNGTIIGNGVLPVLLHQDARYYRMGTGTITHRLLYSLSTTVICKGDSGKRQPNISNVLGNLVSGGLSNFYYPKAERGATLTIEQGFAVTAEGSFGALLIEFYPDVRKHIHGKNRLQNVTLQQP